MQYRNFGKTGWQVSEIGFGAWGLGGQWGQVDDAESVRSLHYAWEQGVNFVDTAQMYGQGRSEAVIGRALHDWRGHKIYVATKVQPERWPSPDDDNPPMRGRYAPARLRDEVHGCLERLGVERIDLLQLHCWLPAGTVQLDWLETLNELRLEGKIDQFGVSIRDNRPREGVGLARLGLAASQQVVFNLFDQRPAAELFRAGEETGTAYIARVPLDSGSLTGSWTETSYAEWGTDDVRHHMFAGPRFAETLRRVEALKQVVKPHYESLAEAAFRFILADPAVSVVIPGMKNKREIDMNLAYSDGKPFPEALRNELRQHAWPRNFYKPYREDE